MARNFVMIGAALAGAMSAAPVAAAQQSVDSDARCLLAANVFARVEKDSAKRMVAAATSVFYLGRLDARISNEQLKAVLQAQAKTMPAASLGPTMTDCAKRLNEKGLAIRSFSIGLKGAAPAAPAPTPKK